MDWIHCLREQFTLQSTTTNISYDVIASGVLTEGDDGDTLEPKQIEKGEMISKTVKIAILEISSGLEIGYIIAYLDYVEKDLQITSLFTHQDFRGNGIGSFLLRYVSDYANSQGLLTISLDDMSDETDPKKNIYQKMDIPQIEPPFPERLGRVVDVQSLAGWKNFCLKYIKSNRVFFNHPKCPCK